MGSVRGEEENWERLSLYLLLVARMYLHLDSFAIEWGHTFPFSLSCIFTLPHLNLPISPSLLQKQWRWVGAIYYNTQLLLWLSKSKHVFQCYFWGCYISKSISYFIYCTNKYAFLWPWILFCGIVITEAVSFPPQADTLQESIVE